MNNVVLVGRFTADPEIRSNGDMTIARFTLAVDRRIKTEGGQDADFPTCVAFGKTAEFIEKWFKKGDRLGCTGRIQTGSYTNKEGKKVYTTDVVVEQAEFVERKIYNTSADPLPKQDKAPTVTGQEEWMQVDDLDDDEDLPFK